GYTYGGTVSTPSIGAYSGGGKVTYYYSTENKTTGGTVWKGITGTSLDADTYYMYAVIAETDNYNGYTTATQEFVVSYEPGDDYDAPTPTINIIPSEHGNVVAEPVTPNPGQTVILTPKPDEGYAADLVTVTDKNGNKVKVTKHEDGTFSFTEPVGGATVRTDFLKEMGNPFVDVHEEDYFYDPVIWAVEKGITEGTDKTHFSPEDPCTRGHVVTFLWRAAGCPEPTMKQCPFVDVDENAYYYKAVLWAYENGITNGVDGSHFAPDETSTRGESLTFLYRTMGVKTKGSNPFKDVKSEDYYYDAVVWGYAESVTNGTAKDSFSPGADCQREHLITFLYRAYHM
ncbi:MAG: S-layer homology domain-containing protein, partial [Oscillospiraceae bacterium]|nr:S-layer homology domain-containing protein [Oscillospiraceae bacterium]